MGAAARWISPSARDASHALRDIGRLEHHPKVLKSADMAFRGEDLASEVEGLPRVVPCDRPLEPISFLHAVGLSRRDQPRLQEPSADDPQLGTLEKLAPAKVARPLADGTVHETPTHAPGSASWTWRSCDAKAN
jgi:hypothetical protein